MIGNSLCCRIHPYVDCYLCGRVWCFDCWNSVKFPSTSSTHYTRGYKTELDQFHFDAIKKHKEQYDCSGDR